MKISEFKKLIREEVRNVLKESKSRNTRRSLREAKVPKSGTTIDDWDLYEDGYFNNTDEADTWLELFSDEGDITPGNKKKFVAMANKWLTGNGYSWQVKDVISQNEDGEITWRIK